MFIDSSIRPLFSDIKPSHKTNEATVNNLASLATAGSHSPTESGTYQGSHIATSAPSTTSPVTIVSNADGKCSSSEPLWTAFSKFGLVHHTAVAYSRSTSTGLLSQSSPKRSSYKARRVHAELHLRADGEVCPKKDKTSFNSRGSKTYRIVCDVDFPGQDYPFLLVQSFEECVDACDAFNARNNADKCVAALFVPSRLKGADDCYLKSSVDHPVPAKLPIQGAVLVKNARHSQSVATHGTSLMQGGPTLASNGRVSPTSSDPTPIFSSKPASWGPEIKYASAKSVIVPHVVDSKLHGPSQNVPSKQYLDVKSPELLTLDPDILVVGVNDDLSTHYELSLDTGVLDLNESSRALLAPLKNTPHLSRDGGQGGYLNGQHLFIFSDTGSYSTTTDTVDGDFLGFVSSSVSIDVGMNGLGSQPLHLKDGMGQWSDDAGRMRGFAPLTQGEQSYNLAMQGKGQRYAIWPESSIIPLANETALLYAPIVYDNVNHDTKKALFTYTGSTLLSVTAGGMGGPIAQRIVDRIFKQDEIEWGCSGGIRSWGPSGVGGSDGKVYIFGNTKDGMLLSRTTVDGVANRSLVSGAFASCSS